MVGWWDALGANRGTAEWMRTTAGQPAQQAGKGQGIGDCLIGRRHGVERRVFPAAAAGRVGDGMRQRAGAGVAQREVERMHPGMGVGEPAGGLGEDQAGEQVDPDRVVAGAHARIEPSECVGRIGERGEQQIHIRIGVRRAA